VNEPDTWTLVGLAVAGVAWLGWMLWTWHQFYRLGQRHSFDRGRIVGKNDASRTYRKDLDALAKKWTDREAVAARWAAAVAVALDDARAARKQES